MINNEKNKAPLALMELLVMILIFSLAAAVCLQIFSHADQLSRRHTAKVHGILAAQNAAELLKSTHGDYNSVAKMLGGSPDRNGLYTIGNKEWQEQDAYYLQIVPPEDANPYLASAIVQVIYNNEIIFEITVGWQEVHHENK